MPPEEWRPVPGHPAYEASSHGRVRRGEALLHVVEHGLGYLRVRIDGANHLIHRVVCRTFHGEPVGERRIVAHNDGNPGNNAATNVRWATHAENAADRYRHGTASQKLTVADVDAIRKERAQGHTMIVIGRRFGVSRKTIWHIVSGNSWRHTRPTPTPPPLETGHYLTTTGNRVLVTRLEGGAARVEFALARWWLSAAQWRERAVGWRRL